MRKIKKYVAMSLISSMLIFPVASMAENSLEIPPDSPVESNIILAPISEEVDDIINEVQIPDYIEYRGKIAEIDKKGDMVRIWVKDNLDEEFNGMLFYITEDVILLNDKTNDFVKAEELKVGMDVTGYYLKETVMAMSMPPQLAPNVIVINENKNPSFIRISKFDENLISSEGDLKLNVSDDTTIIDKNGNKVNKEDIKNKDLIVFYNIVMESYPAQTKPEKIIVLERKEQVADTPESIELQLNIEALGKININGKEIKLDNEMFENENGIVMIPLRQIAEALGYEVTWDNDAKRVELIKGPQYITLTIGKDNYSFAKMLINLGNVPVVKDSRTFVPFDFLQEVMNLKVEIIDGVINITE